MRCYGVALYHGHDGGVPELLASAAERTCPDNSRVASGRRCTHWRGTVERREKKDRNSSSDSSGGSAGHSGDATTTTIPTTTGDR